MDTIAARRAARAAHEALVSALRDLERAEQSAVLRFATILHEKHYRALGFASMLHYGIDGLGFSQSKTAQFLRLAKDVKRLPALEQALERNEIGWTKAREVGKVATVDTEQEWIDHARKRSRRELERDVREASKRARAARAVRVARRTQAAPAVRASQAAEAAQASQAAEAAQASQAAEAAQASHVSQTSVSPAMLAASSPAESGGETPLVPEPILPSACEPDRAGARMGESPALSQPSLLPNAADDLPPGDPPVRVTFELTALQLAELEKLMEKTQERRSRAEALLAAFGALAEKKETLRAERMRQKRRERAADDNPQPAPAERAEAADHASSQGKCTRVHSPSVQLVVYRCDTCATTTVPTSRGDRKLSAREASEIARAARVLDTRIDTHIDTHIDTGLDPCCSTCKQIPRRLRERVLARDGHRCRRCRSTTHLDVHHIHKRSCDGEHSMENCITLCRTCHVNLHFEEELLERGIAIEREVLTPVDSP